MAAQVLHEDIKELVEELKMLIIQGLEEEPKKHVDKEKPETHQSYLSSQLKEKYVATSQFSIEGMQVAMAPKIAEEVTPLEFPNKELEIDFAPTIEENGIRKEVVATFECSGRIELRMH